MAAHNGLLAPLAMFIIAGAYYFLSAQRIINEDFMDHSVRQMVGLMYLSDVGFNLVTAHLASKSEGKKKASKKAKKCSSSSDAASASSDAGKKTKKEKKKKGD